VSASDTCDAAPVCRITEVESNEPEDAIGDGNTDADWQIVDDLTVAVRAERSGKGTDREYAITVECSDASGNSSTATTTVTVAHSQGRDPKIK